MSNAIITCRGAGKRYWQLDTAGARLRHLLSPSTDASPSVWALHPCDLEIERGEALGIIGRNGSGKSTLLSIIAGILTPTVGSVAVHGRLSALLELGSGFNPEFTGRENAYYNGMLHGFSRAQLDERFDAIEAFAEIGAFIDRPVKTYSSGMFVRLAFAVAVSVDPDILIIDEALAVGDVFFQQKCFERLREMRAMGTTLLFVSHDSSAVYRFCDRAILLEHGFLAAQGDPKTVIETYEAAMIEARDAAQGRPAPADVPTLSDAATSPTSCPEEPPELHHEIVHDEYVSVAAVGITNDLGDVITVFTSEATISVHVSLQFNRSFDDPHVGFKIRNRFGEVVFETNTYCMRRTIGPVRERERLETDFRFRAPLAPGEYTIHLGVADGGYGDGLFRQQLLYRHGVSSFVVLKNHDAIQWDGVVNLAPELSVRRPVASP